MNTKTKCMGVLAVGLGAAAYFATLKKPEYVQHVVARIEYPPYVVKTERKVYGHSLIPGGVTSIVDLHHQVDNSNALTALFARFDWANAQYCTVPKGLWYVSYWGPNGIKWTHSPKSYEGLACISDGHMTVLMRCGNLISWVPMAPIEPNPPVDLDDPIWVALSVTPETPNAPSVPTSPVSEVTNTVTSDGVPVGYWYGVPTYPVPVSTPEPSLTGITGLLTAALLWYKRRLG